MEVRARALSVVKLADLRLRRPMYRVIDRHAQPSRSAREFNAMLDVFAAARAISD
jgi:hypothetical protein